MEIASVSTLLPSITLFLLYLDLRLNGAKASSQEDIAQHLEMGKKLLAAGQLADALSHYHAAVDADPNNYLTFFRRATVYLALGKSKSALPDLDRVLELRPDFIGAKAQRGNVYLRQGKLESALRDYQDVLKVNPENDDALSQMEILRAIPEEIRIAKSLYENQDYESAIDYLTKVIEVCPWDPELRELRAESYINLGDYFKAVGDIRSTTKLRIDNTKAYYKLSLLHYDMGEADESLNQIRECLKLDPEHKDCFPHYKKVKKLVKQMQSAQDMVNEQRYEDCVEKAKQMLKTESINLQYVLRAKSKLCHCYSKEGNLRDAVSSCDEVIRLEEDNTDAYCDKAEAYILNDLFEDAIGTYQEAQNINSESDRIREGLSKSHKLLKQSQKRDYYKILGVKRTAKKKEIIKAYRKLAIKWHPDKYEGGDVETAKKMFHDIASAKEVLTNPEKREQFDRGEDPLDPEQQQQNAQHHHGFNPFGGGGGGFNFKFHFN